MAHFGALARLYGMGYGDLSRRQAADYAPGTSGRCYRIIARMAVRKAGSRDCSVGVPAWLDALHAVSCLRFRLSRSVPRV